MLQGGMSYRPGHTANLTLTLQVGVHGGWQRPLGLWLSAQTSSFHAPRLHAGRLGLMTCVGRIHALAAMPISGRSGAKHLTGETPWRAGWVQVC